MNEQKSVNYETRYLLAMIASVINQRDMPMQQTKPDWEYIYKIADRHNVANILYYGTICFETEKNEEWKKNFEDNYMRAVYGERKYSAIVPQIIEAFEAKEVDAMLLKDYLLRNYYPHPDMRELSNVKFYIDKGDVEVAQEVLENLGFEPKEFSQKDEIAYYKIPGITIILQTSLNFVSNSMKKYFSTPVKKYDKKDFFEFIHAFSKHEYYVYLIASFAETFAKGKMEIRDLLDVWFYYKENHKTLDFEHIEKRLVKLGISKFHSFLIPLCAYWFGGIIAVDKKEVFLAFENYIFSKGHLSRERCAKILPIINEIEKDRRKEERKRDKDQHREWLFPSLEYMQGMFVILKYLPFLLPFCWVIRNVRISSRKRNDRNKDVKVINNNAPPPVQISENSLNFISDTDPGFLANGNENNHKTVKEKETSTNDENFDGNEDLEKLDAEESDKVEKTSRGRKAIDMDLMMKRIGITPEEEEEHAESEELKADKQIKVETEEKKKRTTSSKNQVENNNSLNHEDEEKIDKSQLLKDLVEEPTNKRSTKPSVKKETTRRSTANAIKREDIKEKLEKTEKPEQEEQEEEQKSSYSKSIEHMLLRQKANEKKATIERPKPISSDALSEKRIKEDNFSNQKPLG